MIDCLGLSYAKMLRNHVHIYIFLLFTLKKILFLYVHSRIEFE